MMTNWNPRGTTPPDYERQISRTIAKIKAWLKANPDKVPKVQWNFSKNCVVIATIKDAAEQHFVSFNEAGWEMVQACTDPAQHTVLMLRCALEYALL